MREIVFDTETTGLDSRADRVIEIGAIELLNRFPTGRVFHHYVNPQGRDIHPDAEAVHGIGMAQLADKPGFDLVAPEFLDFIEGAILVAHNASFDMGFINAEFARLGIPAVSSDLVLDTLALARRKHPMGPNSLDALCRRYGVDSSRRTKHGALLDSELLAEVYIELIGGKQAALGLDNVEEPDRAGKTQAFVPAIAIAPRARALPPRLTDQEREAHAQMVAQIGDNALWTRVNNA